MRVIGIVFSDLHLGEYTKFNQDNKRTLSIFRVLLSIKKECLKHKCPAFFCGDFMHKSEFITSSLEEMIIDQFSTIQRDEDFNIYGISGNHDMSLKNGIERRSPSHWKNLCNKFHFLHNLDFDYHDFGKFRVVGVPYIDSNIGLNEYIKNIKIIKPTILLLHTDYPGAKDTDGVEVGTVQNLNVNLLDKFKLTLIGHIHKPQRLGKKVFMVGAPLQQRRTDRDCDMGIWYIKEDFSMEFKPLSGYPKFIDVEDESEIKDDGNYYTVIAKSISKEVETLDVSKPVNNTRGLVRRYCRCNDIKDKDRRKLLWKVIKEAEDDTVQ